MIFHFLFVLLTTGGKTCYFIISISTLSSALHLVFTHGLLNLIFLHIKLSRPWFTPSVCTSKDRCEQALCCANSIILDFIFLFLIKLKLKVFTFIDSVFVNLNSLNSDYYS